MMSLVHRLGALAAAWMVLGCACLSRSPPREPAHTSHALPQRSEQVAETEAGVDGQRLHVQNYLSECLYAVVETKLDPRTRTTLTVSAKQSVGHCGCKSALVRYALVSAVREEVLAEGEINTLQMQRDSATVAVELPSADEQSGMLTLGCSNSL
ncbi:MAG: hypothetical protein JWN04_3043 [Myxococcaceae bacterium]|nr:hypothetical protein [Myxococcaceae bacterium]